MGKIKYMAALLIAVACLGPQRAKADLITYYLTQGNPAISSYTGPYATVAADRTDFTHATIKFTSLTGSGNNYLMGGPSSVAVNGGSGNVERFGVLNQTIHSFSSFDGFKHTSSTISFTLTNSSGSWSNAGQVLKANAKDYFAAVHIFVTASAVNAMNRARVSGFAAGPGTGTVPDGGATVMLLGVALGALGIMRRCARS